MTPLEPDPGAPTPDVVPNTGTPAPAAQLETVLATPIAIDGTQQAFGALTREQVGARAAELKAAVGFGPTIRVAPVALAWRELEIALDRAGVGIVAELGAESILALAPKLWVLPPGGSLL